MDGSKLYTVHYKSVMPHHTRIGIDVERTFILPDESGCMTDDDIRQKAERELLFVRKEFKSKEDFTILKSVLIEPNKELTEFFESIDKQG